MKRILGGVASVLFCILALESCSLNTGTSSEPAPEFRITHLSPNQGGLDLYIGGNLYTSNLTYTNSTQYYTIAAGPYNFLADATGTNVSIINTQLNFSPAIDYSVFIIDSASAISTATVQDDLTASTDSARIRILDFAPIGDTVNIVTTGTPPLAITSNGRFFNDEVNNSSYENFISIPAGTYTFSVVQAGTTNALTLAGGSQTQTFAAGGIYTLALSGVLNSYFSIELLTLLNIPDN